jgi:hypothetical protein
VQAVESGIMTEIHFSDVSSVAHTDILSSWFLEWVIFFFMRLRVWTNSVNILL